MEETKLQKCKHNAIKWTSSIHKKYAEILLKKKESIANWTITFWLFINLEYYIASLISILNITIVRLFLLILDHYSIHSFLTLSSETFDAYTWMSIFTSHHLHTTMQTAHTINKRGRSERNNHIKTFGEKHSKVMKWMRAIFVHLQNLVFKCILCDGNQYADIFNGLRWNKIPLLWCCMGGIWIAFAHNVNATRLCLFMRYLISNF